MLLVKEDQSVSHSHSPGTVMKINDEKYLRMELCFGVCVISG